MNEYQNNGLVIMRYIARQFGNPTGIGGRLATVIMNLLNRRMYTTCRKVIKSIAPKRVLDVGVGNGYALHLLSKTLNGALLSGVDISEDAVRMAQQQLKGKAKLSVGDVANLSFDPGSFDVIYTINTIYFWSDPLKGLHEVKRTLAQGGVFINVCYTKQWLDRLRYTQFGFHKMNSDEMVELHRRAGFSQVESVEITSGKSFYIFCRK